jgi:hypothetical protein
MITEKSTIANIINDKVSRPLYCLPDYTTPNCGEKIEYYIAAMNMANDKQCLVIFLKLDGKLFHTTFTQ